MPVQSTVCARNDGAIGSGGGSVTFVTQNGFAFAVLQSEIIWSFIVTCAIPDLMSAYPSENNDDSRRTLSFEHHPLRTLLQYLS